MPGLDDERLIVDYYPPNFIELTWTESSIPSQNDWTQPKLGFISLSANMNMDRFGTVKTVEEEPVWAQYPGNPRHDRSDSILSSSSVAAKD
jgi:hypothetical protein